MQGKCSTSELSPSKLENSWAVGGIVTDVSCYLVFFLMTLNALSPSEGPNRQSMASFQTHNIEPSLSHVMVCHFS